MSGDARGQTDDKDRKGLKMRLMRIDQAGEVGLAMLGAR